MPSGAHCPQIATPVIKCERNLTITTVTIPDGADSCDDADVKIICSESGDEAETLTVPAVSETAVPAETAEGTLNGAEKIAATVYWVKSGEVWHTTDKCSSLSRSKNILSGEIADAIANGKSRACKICGD